MADAKADGARVIDVARDFSTYPRGREPQDGPDNATRFREELLAPALRESIASGGEVVVALDGVTDYSASFLEEAFGGLIGKEGLAASDVRKHLRVRAGMPGAGRYLNAIQRYLDGAKS